MEMKNVGLDDVVSKEAGARNIGSQHGALYNAFTETGRAVVATAALVVGGYFSGGCTSDPTPIVNPAMYPATFVTEIGNPLGNGYGYNPEGLTPFRAVVPGNVPVDLAVRGYSGRDVIFDMPFNRDGELCRERNGDISTIGDALVVVGEWDFTVAETNLQLPFDIVGPKAAKQGLTTLTVEDSRGNVYGSLAVSPFMQTQPNGQQ